MRSRFGSSISFAGSGSPKVSAEGRTALKPRIAFFVVLFLTNYVLLSKLLFGYWFGFLSVLAKSAKTDVQAALDGDYYEAKWADTKAGLHLAWAFGCGAAEYFLLMKLIGKPPFP